MPATLVMLLIQPTGPTVPSAMLPVLINCSDVTGTCVPYVITLISLIPYVAWLVMNSVTSYVK